VVVVAAPEGFLDLVVDRGGSEVIQQGQVFKEKARSVDGEPFWAYRYRVAGRGSTRLQLGGFLSRAADTSTTFSPRTSRITTSIGRTAHSGSGLRSHAVERATSGRSPLRLISIASAGAT
jgi:hypothetical protein